jgi:hypothetical protein
MKIALVLVLSMTAAAASAPRSAPTERTVYITATDDKREPIPDLTAADFVVKEGGKEREIVKA